VLDAISIPAPPPDAVSWHRLPHQRVADAARELAGMLAAGDFRAVSPDTRYALRRLATEGQEIADLLADQHERTRVLTARETRRAPLFAVARRWLGARA
jgi:hypothetical protein